MTRFAAAVSGGIGKEREQVVSPGLCRLVAGSGGNRVGALYWVTSSPASADSNRRGEEIVAARCCVNRIRCFL